MSGTVTPLPTPEPVLVVGAGPVGVTLACELLIRGVRVRLIDAAPRVDESDPHSKGILIWPRSLEILRGIGVADRLVAAGHRVPSVSYYSDGRWRGTAEMTDLLGTPYPFVLTLPQRETERILRTRLAELGGVVERGVALEELDASGPRPQAVLAHADGRRERVRPEWLVGADGPASVVRRSLDIPFDGDPIDVTYAIGDADVRGDVPSDAGYYYSRTGVVALVPLRDGHYRIAANVPHRDESEGDPPAALFEKVVRERAGLDVRVGELDWSRSFRPRLGLSPRFGSGRCLLVGDAVHVISPAGGQGMNVGFQDAVNLGWKLAGAVAGRFDESVVATYATERPAAAGRMSRTTAAQARFALQRTTAAILKRDAIFTTARRLGLLARYLTPLLGQTDLDYANGGSNWNVLRNTGPARVGQRVPVFAGEPLTSGGPVLDRDAPTVLVWGGARRHRLLAEVVGARLADLAPVHVLAPADRAQRALLRRGLGARPAVLVLRPDGHLAHRAPLGTDVSATRAHLEGLRPSGVAAPAVATTPAVPTTSTGPARTLAS